MADSSYVEWNEKTFDLIEEYSGVFEEVAQAIAEVAPEAKVTAQALAGAMAKENSAVQRDPAFENQKDNVALAQMANNATCCFQYDMAKKWA